MLRDYVICNFYFDVLKIFANEFLIYLLGAPALACMWGSESNLGESVLSFHHVSPRTRTQVLRLGGKCLYPHNYLSGSFYFVEKGFLNYRSFTYGMKSCCEERQARPLVRTCSRSNNCDGSDTASFRNPLLSRISLRV